MTAQRHRMDYLRSWQLGLGLIGVVCAGLTAMSAMEEDPRFYQAWLIGWLPCWEMSMGSLGVLMLYHLMAGNWGLASKRALRAAAALIPLVAVGFLPIAFGITEIFPWAAPDALKDPLIEHKSSYLNQDAFLLRAGLYFVLWFALSWSLRATLLHRMREVGKDKTLPMRSAVGLILLVISMSFAAIDWGMSLDPHWFSAIYGGLYVAGGGVLGIVLAILAVCGFRQGRAVKGVQSRWIRRDLGNLLLAMVMVWTYFTFSQYLIIWSADLPEESVWYLARGRNGWQFLSLFVSCFHFVVPFALLLSPEVKEHPLRLTGVAAMVLVAHLVHVFWLIAPSMFSSLSETPWVAFAAVVGLPCLWLSVWLTILSRTSEANA